MPTLLLLASQSTGACGVNQTIWRVKGGGATKNAAMGQGFQHHHRKSPAVPSAR
jgi:hypothetical protein